MATTNENLSKEEIKAKKKAARAAKRAERRERRLRNRVLIAVPGALLTLLVIYVFFDWYNTVPYDAEQKFSQFEPPQEDWEMVSKINEAFAGRSEESHGVVLYTGKDAFSARLAMINQAQHTIDMQYFLIKPDSAGAIFAEALIRAADRGVRVRFLIDDVFTTTTNDQMRLLASYPGVELRYYSPLSRKVWKYANYVLDPNKSNRRMHNKSLTVDGIVGVVGGRNIADEYYDLSDEELFADLDIFVAGEVVRDIGRDFDFYWNDELAIDANLLLGAMSDEERDAKRAEIVEQSGQAIEETYKKAVDQNFIQEIENGDYEVFHFEADSVVDQPAKLRQTMRGRQHYPIVKTLEELIKGAEKEVFVTSPYFVPEDWGSEMFQERARAGVHVRIVTNSLQASNHAYVNGGYYYRRKELLEAGVELFEARADANEVLQLANADGEYPTLTMHTKLFIIDREKVFIGSPNFDPRSMYINTEFGLLIESPELAEDLLKIYDQGVSLYTYEVKLNEKGKVTWTFNLKNPDEVYEKEPADWTRKVIQVLAHIVPLELQY